jgi:hypothetical protein
LTINPHTGLAEAGFLNAMLPMILGAGLAAATGGSSLLIGAGIGGLQAARTGSLKQGLMAGLGAYGGAGLASSLGAAGASSLPTSAIAAPPAPVIPSGVPNFGPAFTDAQAFNPELFKPAVVAGATGTAGTAAGTTPPTTPTPSAIPGGTTAENFRWDPITKTNVPITTPTPTATPMAIPEVTPVAASTPTPTPKTFAELSPSDRLTAIKEGASADNITDWATKNKYTAAGTAGSVALGMQEEPKAPDPADPGMIRPYTFERTKNADAFQDMPASGYAPLSSRERNYFTDQYTAQTPYKAPGPEYMAAGGPVETMSNNAAMGANTMYPMANMATSSFATPYQSPVSTNMLAPTSDSGVTMNGEPSMQGTRMAGGGQVPQYGLGGALGSYSDGGRMLKGPGDGMSDNIPAVIGKKQPARLADGEFVVPADVVSHLGNGSTDAGAKQLYAMMDKIRAARTGTKKQGKQINPRKYMPA